MCVFWKHLTLITCSCLANIKHQYCNKNHHHPQFSDCPLPLHSLSHLQLPPLSCKDLTHCLHFLHPCLLGTPQNTHTLNWQPLPFDIQQYLLYYEGKFALNVFLTCLTLMRQKFWRTVESLSVTDSWRMLTPKLKSRISAILK